MAQVVHPGMPENMPPLLDHDTPERIDFDQTADII